MPAFQMNERKPYKPEAKWDDSIPPNWPLLPLMVPPFLSPVSLPALKDGPHTTWYSHLTACITYLGMIPWGFQLYRETTPPFFKKALWDRYEGLLAHQRCDSAFVTQPFWSWVSLCRKRGLYSPAGKLSGGTGERLGQNKYSINTGVISLCPALLQSPG